MWPSVTSLVPGPIEPDTKRVRVRDGYLVYDRLIVSPGIEFQWDQVEGLAQNKDTVLHAWKAGPQTAELARQPQAMPDRGVFAGKRAMCALTIGGPASMYGRDGLNGPIDSILFPINHGMLYFTGFAVLEPFLVHAPARLSDAERAAQLMRYRECVLGLDAAPTLAYPRLAEFDENYVLKRP